MPAGLTGVQQAVLGWGSANRRDLPWRSTRDPWAVLVSELMLQQTQVERVVPRYVAFLCRFSSPEECARAGAGEVIRDWAGLGYNRRAVNLHRAAVIITASDGPGLPDTLEGLMHLPGVGPYTARAVLAFAFERDVGVVDTNVGRVLARHEGHRLSARDAQATADRLVPPGRGWDWNQALVDLGATVCRKREPECGRCPLRISCAWRRAGGPDPADGSAGVSGSQSRFEGSERQARGRLVRALRVGPAPLGDLPAITGWHDAERARAIADSLVDEGLAALTGDTLRLPP